MDDFSEPVGIGEELTSKRISHHLDCLAVDCEWRASEVWQYIRLLEQRVDNNERAYTGVIKFLSNELSKCCDGIERAFEAKEWSMCLDELEKIRYKRDKNAKP